MTSQELTIKRASTAVQTNTRSQAALNASVQDMSLLWQQSPTWKNESAWMDLIQMDDYFNIDRVKFPVGPFDESLELLNQPEAPASTKDLMAALGLIQLHCRGRHGDEDQTKAWLMSMAKILAEYPGYAILDACAEWLHISQWLPAPAELIELAKPKYAWRSRMIRVLKGAKWAHANNYRDGNALIE